MSKTEVPSFEEISAVFENKDKADALREVLVLKPVRYEPVYQVTHSPRVKKIALAIHRAYPVSRSYI